MPRVRALTLSLDHSSTPVCTPWNIQPPTHDRRLARKKSSSGSSSGRHPAAAAPGKGLPLSALDIFVLSALAKIGATLVTYPMLVVKSRLQVWVLFGSLRVPCVLAGAGANRTSPGAEQRLRLAQLVES